MNIEIMEDYRGNKVPQFMAGDILIIETKVSDDPLGYYFVYEDKDKIIHLINLEKGIGVWTEPKKHAELVARLQHTALIKSITVCNSENINLSLKV